jgi:hypothetical protein
MIKIDAACKTIISRLIFVAVVFVLSLATFAQQQDRTSSSEAERSYGRLLELKLTLERIVNEDYGKEPHKSFLDQNKDDLVFSDPSGEYYVRSERFWALSEKYRSLPIADRIAWTAAQNPLPGECEGDVLCYLDVTLITSGRYLDRFPNGKFVSEALVEISSTINALKDGPQSDSLESLTFDEAGFAVLRQQLNQLRSIVLKSKAVDRKAVADAIEKTKRKLKSLPKVYN